MCGIAAYFGVDSIPDERVERCLDLMRRRGPDARGVFRGETAGGRRVVLLNSRLAIVDLDHRSDQPFRYQDKIVTFNGEIYNHPELRRELGSDPTTVPFRTTSDTETLARLIDREGVDGLAAAEGMWAFALYDETRETLLLARDRFGEKPLYLFRDESGLYCGSEVKFIEALLGRRLAVDETHLIRFMVNGYKSLNKDGHCFFLDVEELSPGTALTIDAEGRETTTRYWSGLPPAEEEMEYDRAVERVREALFNAVSLRLRADVPIAFCLSGGIDSNALIGIARRVFGREAHGFTVMNTDTRYEEGELVELAVAAHGVRHTAIPVDPANFLTNLRELVRQHDAPVLTITYYLHWRLMESVAAHGYKVVMSGTGADELFAGYYDHQAAYLACLERSSSFHERARADWERTIGPYVRNPFLKDPDVFIRAPSERRHLYLDNEIFASYLIDPWSEAFHEKKFGRDLLRDRMLNEIFHETVPPILHEDDLNAMYHSIENRSPFLDTQLFNVAFSTPTRHLIRAGRGKALLRDAVRGLVPDRILDNPRKVGFNAPMGGLLRVDDPATREWLLDDGPVFRLLRKDRLETLLSRPEWSESESKFLFSVVNAKMFLEEFGR